MNDFRCYIVDSSGHTRFRVEITAADLEAAKQDAYGILRMKREQSLLSMHGIELWRGIDRLYRSTGLNKNERVRMVSGSGKDQSVQVAALNGAAEYVKHHSGSAAFIRGSIVIGQQRSVKELGEKLESLAATRSHGGIVTLQEVDAVVYELNHAGFFIGRKSWDDIEKAFPTEC